MKLIHNQIVIGNKWATIVTLALIVYGVITIYFNWDPDDGRNDSNAVVVGLLHMFGCYVIYHFLAGKDMQVLLMRLKFDDSDVSKIGRWLSFVLLGFTVLFIPFIAAGLW